MIQGAYWPPDPPYTADGRMIYDLAFFRNFSAFTGHYRQHNAALKFFRSKAEMTTPHEDIKDLAATVMVKEVGAGIGPDVARRGAGGGGCRGAGAGAQCLGLRLLRCDGVLCQ